MGNPSIDFLFFFSIWNESLVEFVVICPTEMLIKIILLPDAPSSDNSNGCRLTDIGTRRF